MSIVYNENDPKAAAWLRELVLRGHLDGVVDDRSIVDIDAPDARRVHLFAGIGGWELALRWAGWPEDLEVWTGSCPCQPFSSAGKRKGINDERHLWPHMFRLIRQRRPKFVFGEQVASAEVVGTVLEASFVDSVRRGDYARANKFANRLAKAPNLGSAPRWISGVRSDLESIGYTVWFAVLGAHSVGAPHIRQRLWWVAHTRGIRRERSTAPQAERIQLRMPNPHSEIGWPIDGPTVPCRDGKRRRLESGIEPLAHGIPARVVRLRGYGNAIVPRVAAEFVKATMDELGIGE